MDGFYRWARKQLANERKGLFRPDHLIWGKGEVESHPSSSFVEIVEGGMERVQVADYLVGAHQKIPG